MRHHIHIPLAIAAVAVLIGAALTGCAKTKADIIQEYRGQEPLPKPDRILVYDFAVSPYDVSINSAIGARVANLVTGTSPSDEQQKVGRAIANVLAEELINQLELGGFTAQRVPTVEPPPMGTLAIEGQFVTIDEGNRLRRMVIGFGAGGSEVRTQVRASLGRPGGRLLLEEFVTSAESSKKPGIGPMVGVGGAVSAVGTAAVLSTGVGAVTELDQTVEGDARRTAQEIVKQLCVLYVKEGWNTQGHCEKR